MRVVHVCPCFVNLDEESGGVANVVRQLCLGQRAAGHDIVLICTTTELGRQVATSTHFVHATGIKVFVVWQYESTLLGPVGRFIDVLSFSAAGAESHIVFHVHTCFSAATDFSMRWLKRKRFPFVFSPHGKLSSDMFVRKGRAKALWWKAVTRSGVSGAAVVGILADAEAVLFGSLGLHCPVRKVPNGFFRGNDDEIKYQEFDVAKSVEFPDKYVIFLGYLESRKQPLLLIRAFCVSAARKLGFKLVLVGPDSYGHRKQLEAEVSTLGISDAVIFYGPAYGSEKAAILRNASCLCLPSIAEGLPVVLCEALGFGIPSIASAACNFPEVADAGAGIVVNGYGINDWASAIDDITLSLDRRRTMSVAAINMSIDYHWDKIVERWIVVYKNINREI